MKVYKEVTDRYDFEFWSGAKDTVKYMTDEQVEKTLEYLDELNPEGMSETEVNDIFWFEDDWIAEMLGFSDFDALIRYNNGEDEEEEEDEDEDEDEEDD